LCPASEPPPTERTLPSADQDGEGDNEVTMFVLDTEGEKDVDDKNSRPGTGEVFMSTGTKRHASGHVGISTSSVAS